MANGAPSELTMQRSIDTQLFEWPSQDPRLIGSECRACGVIAFPRQSSCPSCCSSTVVPRRLGQSGRLWTWTTQEFLPKPPYAVARNQEEFVPFKVGYIELPGEVLVESRITAPRHQALAIGMPMRLTFEPLFTDEAGVKVMSFAFEPEPEGA
jgi:uncharacterized OB-fold protein